MSDKQLIKSYVWYGDECFFVSTFDRDSSAMLGPRRFAETIVWKFDWNTNTRGEEIAMDCGTEGTTYKHFNLCKALFDKGISGLEEMA